MEPNTAVNAFLPLWIFAPFLLIGIVGWITTPNPNLTHEDRLRSNPNEPGLRAGNVNLASR